MNKGFAYYFKKSNNIFSFVMKKQKFSHKLALLLYTIVSTLGKCIFFIRPIFLVSDQNIANMFVHGHSFSISKSFQGVKEKYSKLFIVDMIQFLTYLGILLAIAVALSPTIIAGVNTNQTTFYPIIGIILGIAWLLICFVLSLDLNFVSYVASKRNKLDLSDYVFNSKTAVNGNRKTILAQKIVYSLLSVLPFALTLGGLILVIVFLAARSGFTVLTIIVSLCFIAPITLFYYLLSASQIIKQQIFINLLGDDICSLNKRIVVKKVASSEVEYEPILDTSSDEESVEI